MLKRNRSTRLFTLFVMASTLGLAAGAWGQDPPKKKKKKNKEGSSAVTKVLKKVDRQILSYSPASAREQLQPVLEENDPRVGAAMGQILILEKDYEGAVAKLEAAASQASDSMILVALGDAKGFARDKGGAEASYRRAVEAANAALTADAADTQARLALGIAQQRLGSYDQAVTELTRAQGEDSGNERIPFELGLTKMLQGDNQAAFNQLSRAIELNSGYAYAYYYRALAADKINRKDITVNDLDRFLALAPDAPEAPKAQRILQAARG